MSLEGCVRNRNNNSFRQLVDSVTVAWDFTVADQASANLAAAYKTGLDAWIADRAAVEALVAAARREVLTAARTYYVGFNLPAPTFTNGSANVGMVAHGLSLNDPVILSILPSQTAATISAANPAVITMANAFAANRPVVFSSTGLLPIPLVAGTTYYVIAAGLSGTQFEVSASVGGAAINTTAPTAGFTNGSANITVTNASTYLKLGQIVRFANSGGGLPTNFAAATDYYVVSVSATTITVAATGGGAAIVAGSAGTGTQTIVQAGTHYVSAGGAMPTFSTAGLLVAGTVYFVKTVVDADTVTLATTLGGTALGTATVATGSPIYSAYTGSDSNNGLAQTRAGALLTAAAAITLLNSIDMAGFAVTVQFADGTYTGQINVAKPFVGGNPTFQGNSTFPQNCLITRAGVCIVGNAWSCRFAVGGFKLNTTGSGNAALYAQIGCCIDVTGTMDFGGASIARHMRSDNDSIINITSTNYYISAGVTDHILVLSQGQILRSGGTITLLNIPAWGSQGINIQGGQVTDFSVTYVGSATGKRYAIVANGLENSFGAGTASTYFPGDVNGTTATGGQQI